MESSLQRGMRWQFITSYVLRKCNDILNTILRCYVINWFHRIRYTTTVFSADAIVGNAVSAALSQKTLSNFKLYLASNLKFHVSLANFKKKIKEYLLALRKLQAKFRQPSTKAPLPFSARLS